ncbi:MAG: thymidine phosphorylase, partial [Actinobacteria bacterium]|nr:thymidine phosphorylase [Actinomycetota bacterium]
MLPQEIIRIKRDGGRLSAEQIGELVAGITSGAVADAQVGAFAMAAFLQGMDLDECVALTRAMTASGTQLSWSLDGPVLDKHSTGGVGDTVSLMLGPMVAACGGYVPMISGRGLGHTGGTYDKFESIPGYRASPSMAEFRRVVQRVGCAIIGQTSDLAPADKRLYGVRDVTPTVESIPLITASILSKKLAAGLGGLVLDVKHGSGAFMPELDRARALARALVDVAVAAGLPCSALLTDMDQVLGRTAGNALEVRESLDVLTGAADPDQRLVQVTLALAEEALRLGGLEDADPAEALRSGAAAERFAQMAAALDGPADLLERYEEHLETAPVIVE